MSPVLKMDILRSTVNVGSSTVTKEHSGGGVANGGGCACAGAGGLWGISILSSQFCWEPKLHKKINLQIIKKMYILSLPILLGWL